MSPARWTDSCENFLGRWAIPYLTRGLVALNAGAWLLNLASPGFTSILKLDPAQIEQGEYWRLVDLSFRTLQLCPPYLSSAFSLVFMVDRRRP